MENNKKNIKILITGDSYGKASKAMLHKYIPLLKNKYNADLVITNVENMTDGKGLTLNDYNFCKRIGIDVLTGGNHIFFRKETVEKINEFKDLIVPMNFNRILVGKGTILLNKFNKTIRITNLIGRTFMDHYENPFLVMDDLLKSDTSDIHIVDFHAETTSEKLSFAKCFDGKLSLVYGTHTHVQTSDERLLPNKTGFITDIGMTGPYHGIIGANPDEVISRFKTGMLSRFKEAPGEGQLSGILVDIDYLTNNVINIKRILINPDHNFYE